MWAGHRGSMPRGWFCWENSMLQSLCSLLWKTCERHASLSEQSCQSLEGPKHSTCSFNNHQTKDVHTPLMKQQHTQVPTIPPDTKMNIGTYIVCSSSAVVYLYLKLQEPEETLWSCSQGFSLFQLKQWSLKVGKECFSPFQEPFDDFRICLFI